MTLYPAVAGVLLTLLHLLLHLKGADPGTNVLGFLANGVFLAFVPYHAARGGLVRAAVFVAGYLLLFLVVSVLTSMNLIFILSVFIYCPLFRHPRALLHFASLILALTLLNPYWLQATIIGSLVIEALYAAIVVKPSTFVAISFVAGLAMVVFILLPILYLLAMSTPQTLVVTLRDESVRNAIWTSLWTATTTMAVATLLGVPLAYALTRTEFRGKPLVLALIDLPILIPQTVVGLAILVLAGPKAPLGIFLSAKFGIRVSGTALGIVLAQLFVSAPFVVRASMAAFNGVDPKLESISRTLGASQASTFFRVSLPLALRGVLVGATLTWSRAISEAGSLIVLAYRPFTVPVLVADRFTMFGMEEARPIAIVFILACLWIFFLMNVLSRYPLELFNWLRREDTVRGRA